MPQPAPSSDEARLQVGRRRCHALTRRYGTTYYWGTQFLPRRERDLVYGVYALCRMADDIVDEPERPEVVALGLPAETDPAARLAAFADRFYAAWSRGRDCDPTMHAIARTAQDLALPRDCYERFFGAMTLDLTRTTWATWPELRDVYMEGSAAVIGEMMLPALRPRSDAAREPARALGLAFQLTNFLRDVGEDLDRGRVYLPQDELADAGADPWGRTVTPEWRAFMRAQIARNRELYAAAWPGVDMLPPAAARCVAAALVMYAEILTKIEAADFDVFGERIRVSAPRKAVLAARAAASARSRRASASWGGDDAA